MKLWWIRVLASVWHLAFSPDFMDNCLNKSIRSKQNCRILSISSYKQCDGSLVQAKACCLFGTNFKSSVLEPRLKKQTSNFTIIQIKIHNSLGNHTITPVQVKWLNLEQYMDNCIWISHGFTRYLYYNHNKTKHNKILFTFSRIFRFWPFAKKKKKKMASVKRKQYLSPDLVGFCWASLLQCLVAAQLVRGAWRRRRVDWRQLTEGNRKRSM